MKSPKQRRQLSLLRLVPNLMTLGALCAGLTALRFALMGRFDMAVALVILAGILDAGDGYAARKLRSSSSIGAELDSLADLVNFGVVPGLIIYLWTLQDIRNPGWIAVLIYVICCTMRLARFNVDSKAEEDQEKPTYFTGVPSPAGALLALLPIYVGKVIEVEPLPPTLAALVLVVVGFLMISRIPTPSIKSARIYAENARYYLLGSVALIACLATWPWVTLTAGSVTYIGAVGRSVARKGRRI